MTSNINPNIITTFPVAGTDNDSQIFRDNYDAIKVALLTAKNEITDLQTTAAKLNTSNDFSGNSLINANLASSTSSAFNGGSKIVADQDINFNNGHYQIFQVGKDVTFNLTNWPVGDKVAGLRVAIYGDSTSELGETEKSEKCQRDIGYFITGASYDMVLGTNYNARFLGYAETNSVDLNATVRNTIVASLNELKNLPEVFDESETRVNGFYTELLNIYDNGRNAASALYFTNPADATTGRIAAKNRLLANLANGFITAEINAYVFDNFGSSPTFTHDVAKCSRDVKYAVESFAYDILYGGNFATYYNARLFLYFSTTIATGIAPEHKTQTYNAYLRLREIVGQIVLGETVIPSRSNTTTTQSKEGVNATQTEADRLRSLAATIANVINNGATSIPSKIDYPTYDWSDLSLRNAKEAIDLAKQGIINTVAGSNVCVIQFTSPNKQINYDKAYPLELKVSSAKKTKVIEFWAPGNSTTLFAKYIGEFDLTRYGTIDIGGGSAFIGALDDLSDVIINSPTSGQTIRYNGTEFVNAKLEYSDILNSPEVKTDLSQFTNTGSDPYLQKSFTGVTTDDLDEGLGNWYFTPERFAQYFAIYNSQAISNIVDDVITDSIETSAIPVGTGITDTIELSNKDLIDHYRVGMGLRIFGAGTDNNLITTTPVFNTSNPIQTGLATPAGKTAATKFAYKIAQFSYTTGKYSVAGPNNADGHQTGTFYLGTDSPFNLTNNFTLSFTRSDPDYGILVYRKVVGDGQTTDFELISVMGPKELGSDLTGEYIDYYDFNYNSWSKKSIDNRFLNANPASGLVHFPLTAPTVAGRGWVDTVITELVTTRVGEQNVPNGQLKLASAFYFNSSFIISHDDTAIIQEAIDTRVDGNLNSLRLGDKRYIVKSLTIPSGFSLFGRSKRSELRKLSWSSTNALTNKMIKSANNVRLDLVSVSDFKIDGNMQNQFLIDDGDDEFANYAIDIRGSNHNFENLIVKNCIGGGLASINPVNLTINLCQIEDSGLTDLEPFSPLIASGGTQLLITSNVFKNHSDAIDISVTSIGVLNANVITNCGSGVLIFGSTKLISSPNVILGPAGEFIPGPDIFNSEYDSININLEPATEFISGSHVYQENGEPKDLHANGGFITYRVDRLRELDNVEELYPAINGVIEPVLMNTALTVSAFTQISFSGLTVTTTSPIITLTFDTSTNPVDLARVPKRGLLVGGAQIASGTYVAGVSSPNVIGTSTFYDVTLSQLPTAASSNATVTFDANLAGSRAIKVSYTQGLVNNAKLINPANPDFSATVRAIDGSILYLEQALTGSISTGTNLYARVPPIYDVTATNLETGEYRFNIPKDYVNALKTNFSYSSLRGTTSIVTGTINDGSTNAGTVLTVTGVTTGRLKVGDIIAGEGIAPGTTITKYRTGSGGNGTYVVSISQKVNSTTITVDKDENHKGLVYRAFLTQYVPCGILYNGEAPVILDTQTGVTYYQVVIENPLYLSVGSRVRFIYHGGVPNLNEVVGTIVDESPAAGSGSITRMRYVIKYDEVNISEAGNFGTSSNPAQICVENTFTLSKGRII